MIEKVNQEERNFRFRTVDNFVVCGLRISWSVLNGDIREK